jgi:hypothetical protein
MGTLKWEGTEVVQEGNEIFRFRLLKNNSLQEDVDWEELS